MLIISNLKFIFDLDATITKKELLPEISRAIGLFDEIKQLTKLAMNGKMPFAENFTKRVNLLKNIPLNEIHEIIFNIPLNENIVSFIKENNERCFVLTGNLDVWIDPLMKKIGVKYYSSKAEVLENSIVNIRYVMDKSSFIGQINYEYVAVGDGDNDIGMITGAKIGVAFGGVRFPPSSLLSVASHVIYKEDTLCRFLKQLL